MSDRRIVHADLTGSNCGPDFISVDVRVDAPTWDDERLRQECARHYDIPVEQVTVRQRDAAECANCGDDLIGVHDGDMYCSLCEDDDR